MSPSETSAELGKFAESWRLAFAQVLSEAGLKIVKIEFVDAKTAGAQSTAAKSYQMPLSGSGALRGTFKFATSEEEALRLSLLLMPAAASEASQFGDKQRDAVSELISRAAAKVTAQWGKERAQLDIVTPSAGSEKVCGGLRISAEKLQPLTIALMVSAEFAESLVALTNPAENPKQSPTGASMSTNQPPTNSPEPASNLGLLFDVQLDATIRFGGRQLLLRDILSLSPGSVIELDRQLGEPAELLVAGRVVARGDVVVVDGNFGLRVTEMCNAS